MLLAGQELLTALQWLVVAPEDKEHTHVAKSWGECQFRWYYESILRMGTFQHAFHHLSLP